MDPIAFSLPQEATAERRALRGQLRWLGYAPLYDGLWVSPHPLEEKVATELSKVAVGTMSVFRARHVEIEAIADQRPIEAWDTAALARRYDSFIRRWSALLPGVAAGTVTGAAAVRARTEVMDAYRRFPVLDPLLPSELMPADWPRQAARDVFVAVYDGLAEPAEEHVRAVAARYDAGRLSDIRAHTTTEMRDLLTRARVAADLLAGCPVVPGRGVRCRGPRPHRRDRLTSGSRSRDRRRLRPVPGRRTEAVRGGAGRTARRTRPVAGGRRHRESRGGRFGSAAYRRLRRMAGNGRVADSASIKHRSS